MQSRHLIPMSFMAALALGPASASSQTAAPTTSWPSKPIKLLVAYSAGGSSDQLARLLADHLSKQLKQPVIVDNRPGASGMVGAAACKNAPADGHHFCIFLMDVVTTNPTLFKNAPYKPETDFVPVSYIAETNIVVPVSSKTSIKNIKDLVAESRAHPSMVNWGSWGIGSSAHLLLASMNKSLDANISHVPYKDTPALIMATVSGEVTATIAGYSLLSGYFEKGDLRPIAVLGSSRMKQLPDVPTLSEQGIPINISLWFGMFAPAATPRPVVQAMNEAVNHVVRDPTVIQKYDTMANIAKPMSQPDFVDLVRRETEIWSGIAKQSHIAIE